MLKMSDTDVASVAEQATDAVGIVTVVNVECSFTSWLFGLADGAFVMLCQKHRGVLTWSQPIVFLSVVIFEPLWRLLATSKLIFCHLVEVLQTPLVMAFVVARFAVDLVAVYCSFGLVKFREWFGSLALSAMLKSRRQIEAMAWHKVLPVGRSIFIPTSLYCQGAA
jgi:hypothetical protein